MPTQHAIWTIGDKPAPLSPGRPASEQKLEESWEDARQNGFIKAGDRSAGHKFVPDAVARLRVHAKLGNAPEEPLPLDSDSESHAAALGAVFIDDVWLKYRTIDASKFITRLGKSLIESMDNLIISVPKI